MNLNYILFFLIGLAAGFLIAMIICHFFLWSHTRKHKHHRHHHNTSGLDRYIE